MKHKRLKHAAHIFCHMFCGWRLIMSYGDLERLGSGTVTIDVLTSVCSFDGRPIPTLLIATELSAWFQEEVRAYHIDVTYIYKAMLSADLVLDVIPAQERRTNGQYFGPGQQLLTPSHFVGCGIDARSRIVTDEAVYRSTYHDWEEWPVGRFSGKV
jgi:hypothetical protein